MRKNDKTIKPIDIFDKFVFPSNASFLKNALSCYDKNNISAAFNDFENRFKKYPDILKKNSRPEKALSGLKFFAWFLHNNSAAFKLETAFEGLVLIFLLDEMADNNALPIPYRKNFLEEFSVFVKNISYDTKIIAADTRQKEMQEVWLHHFKKIFCHKNAKKEKWIEAVQDFIRGMLYELDNKKFKTLEEYLASAVPSSGAIFYWQSMITDAQRDRQNNETYNKLTRQIAVILRLTNDFAQTKEDKNKTTALDFCSDKYKLKSTIENELKKFQKMLKKSAAIDKKIRVAMWRSAVFLYYFYQERNF